MRRVLRGLAFVLPALAPALAAADDAFARRFAAAVVESGDAHGRAFAIVDKPGAIIRVFDDAGRLLAHSPVLVGSTAGDASPPDIGHRPLTRVLPHEKVTAAGRYDTESGRNAAGEDIVWLDYEAALSMHRVRDVPGERRPARLRSPATEDNRISFGCINVPATFYERAIDPLFARASGVVYVLPEVLAIGDVFAFARQLDRPGLLAAAPARHPPAGTP